MKQYLLTFLIAASAACTHIAVPAEVQLEGDVVAASSMLSLGRVLPLDGKPR